MSPKSSGLDMSRLEQLAQQPDAKGWSPLAPEDIVRVGYGLFFDQSLGSTGWVVVQNHGGFRVTQSGTFRPADHPGLTSKDLDLARADDLFQSIIRAQFTFPSIGVTGHERPPQGRWVKGDGTSSLMAAVSVRNGLAARNFMPPVIFDARTAKRIICGNANADKKVAHEALTQAFPWIPGAEEHVTTEHHRDALLGAISVFTQGAAL